MHIASRAAGAIAALSLSFTATQAAAVVYVATYEGVIAAGNDVYGEFGIVGDLKDERFTLTYRVDTGTPGAVLNPIVSYANSLEGYNAASPVQGVMTINGISRAFGVYYGSETRYDYSLEPVCPSCSTEAGVRHYAYDLVNTFTGPIYYSYFAGGSITSYGYTGQYAGLAHTPPPSFTDATAYFFGDFSMVESLYNYDTNVRTDSIDVNTSLKIESVTVTVVPEPASWALVITGFGLAGASLRRRLRAA